MVRVGGCRGVKVEVGACSRATRLDISEEVRSGYSQSCMQLHFHMVKQLCACSSQKHIFLLRLGADSFRDALQAIAYFN